MESKIEKLEKRLSTPTIHISRKKIKSESKKRVNYVTILSGEAFKSRQIAEIHVMGVMKTIDQIEIKMKMPNSSQKPPASS